MNQDTLADQVKQLIQENYDLKMQNAADCDEIDNMKREMEGIRQPYKLAA